MNINILKNFVKKNYFLICIYYLIDDFLFKIRFNKGNIETSSGTIHSNFDINDSISYIDNVFLDYKHYSLKSSITGSVAEIGPGDNCGVALLLLENGCDSVDLVDRFYSKRDTKLHARIYSELIKRSVKLSDHMSNVDCFDEATFPGLTRHYGPAAEAESFFNENNKYDFILSRAVMEHVYDPIKSLSKMTKALKSGGMLLHKVDLRDHGMFSQYFHELKYFEVPASFYSLMTRSSGRPNRVLINQYRAFLDKSGLDYKLLITRLAGVGDIDPHIEFNQISKNLISQSLEYVRCVKSKFTKELKNIDEKDLCVAGFFLVATKK